MLEVDGETPGQYTDPMADGNGHGSYSGEEGKEKEGREFPQLSSGVIYPEATLCSCVFGRLIKGHDQARKECAVHCVFLGSVNA